MHAGIIKLKDLITQILNNAFTANMAQIWNVIMEEFFFSELQRRKISFYEIWAGQLLMSADRDPIVRFNDEVKANIVSSEYQQFEKDKITQQDIEKSWGMIERIELSNGEKGTAHAHFFKKDKELWLELPDMYRLMRELASTVGKICEECGSIFSPSKFKPDQKFCSNKCRQRAFRGKNGCNEE